MGSSLDDENKLVLDVVQAALGVISHEMLAISVERADNGIKLYVAVSELNEQVEEDVDDLVFELQALQERLVQIEFFIYVGKVSADWPGISARRVYVSKEA
ncbi:hypothetical protein [Actinoplanes sp. N902-109]|uniref:hypothetical protein n=1 Tax=Actinoplanes sp. (strain N902-109) TaxID=649831 RepID=UPI000329409D|nr:hypothetical protein [Actinoplanes sp. N902-109]AGL14836.1 hypothetical protein L083_1326 [Actinoplanes sp. N902-109]